MKYIITIAILASISMTACNSKTSSMLSTKMKSTNPGDQLLAKTVTAHGGDLYQKAHYGFVFRDKNYTVHNDDEKYEYTMTSNEDGEIKHVVMKNSNVTMTINGADQMLSKSDQTKYGSGVNSVIYFATLPHKLLDPAARTEHKGKTTIKGQNYEILQITFVEEGGGRDHDDQFYYWINSETNLIDYLAYNYQVGKGGVRFRSAYNVRNVGGIIFQDYVNYKAEVGTPLADLPSLYESEKLKKLSVIETEKVDNL